MTLDTLHSILFNWHILYCLVLGVYGAVMAARGRSISGNFWGAVATGTILAAVVLVVGLIMAAQGLRPERFGIYILYMIWLVIIMPGLYSMLRGRDDRNAAVTFALLSFFNAATSISMLQRALVSPWLLP